MINVSEEKTKASKMKQTVIDINDNVATLNSNISKTSELFHGDKVNDYVNELINHSTNIVNSASSLGDQVSSINGAIDLVYQEELAEQKRLQDLENKRKEKKEMPSELQRENRY